MTSMMSGDSKNDPNVNQFNLKKVADRTVSNLLCLQFPPFEDEQEGGWDRSESVWLARAPA